jgi:hypothetical protein
MIELRRADEVYSRNCLILNSTAFQIGIYCYGGNVVSGDNLAIARNERQKYDSE